MDGVCLVYRWCMGGVWGMYGECMEEACVLLSRPKISLHFGLVNPDVR